MKELFLYIRSRIEGSIPELKVELFNDQFVKADTDRNEKAIIYPICYVEFITEEINNLALGFKDYFLRVRFRIGIESYKFERLETFDFVDDFYRAIHMMRPAPNTELYFTSFQEVMPEFDEDHRNVDRPYVDYRTKLRTKVAYKAPMTKFPPTDIEIGVEMLDPVSMYEPSEQSPVFFFEPAENSPVYFRE